MASNDFKVFAGDPAANVLSLAEYDVLPALTAGFGGGVAQSDQFNRVFRQSSLIASMIGDFIVERAGQNAVDDGTTATLLANFITGLQNVIEAFNYITAASPALTGTPTCPTQIGTDNSTKIASTAFVKNAVAPLAPINSPTFTGTPAASTPPANDNSGKLATTGFINGAITNGTAYDAKFKSLLLSGLANLAGGAVVTSPAGNDNSTRVPNTNWVLNQLVAYATQAWTEANFPTFSDFPVVFNNPGYVKLPNGFILQWVSNLTDAAPFDGNGNKVMEWVFPVAFPHACFCTLWTPYNGGALLSMNATIQPQIPNQAGVFAEVHVTGPINGPLAGNAIAIGF